ncbi:hypothetical protein AK812_SmicGene13939 [Symbiodinium microadriaticum]|uniref:Uncharacterized protein n=1 Tax=Symbiodinium microadriaticum TaxID=2951 RepID=A0A1Q9E6T3_SYMMI|nr:hypothetical protein AK812_SmicGene13939 [Symbiodinium microadriaticum]
MFTFSTAILSPRKGESAFQMSGSGIDNSNEGQGDGLEPEVQEDRQNAFPEVLVEFNVFNATKWFNEEDYDSEDLDAMQSRRLRSAKAADFPDPFVQFPDPRSIASEMEVNYLRGILLQEGHAVPQERGDEKGKRQYKKMMKAEVSHYQDMMKGRLERLGAGAQRFKTTASPAEAVKDAAGYAFEKPKGGEKLAAQADLKDEDPDRYRKTNSSSAKGLTRVPLSNSNASNTTSQTEGSSRGATKVLLEDNDKGIKELDTLVTQAEDLTSR